MTTRDGCGSIALVFATPVALIQSCVCVCSPLPLPPLLACLRVAAGQFPPASGVLEEIEKLHARHPDGFKLEAEPKARRRGSVLVNFTDCDTRELASFCSLEVQRETKMRWRRIRVDMKMHLLEGLREHREQPAAA